MNIVHLMGRVGNDIEVRRMPNGEAVANISIATSVRYNDKQGNKQELTEWHRVVSFGKQAEILGEHATKGTQLIINGSLKTKEWEKDGVKRQTTEVQMDKFNGFEFAGPKVDRQDPQANHGNKQSSQQESKSDDYYDDPLPF
jgi:single-strand DNA-binding protein